MKSIKALLGTIALVGSLLGSTNVLAETTQAVTTPAQQVTVQTVTTETPAQVAVVGDKLNINTASAAEIQKVLTGIGAKKAEAIVQYREKHGAFTSIEQLLEVQGIGQSTLDKNKDRIIF
ncbi:competence protein ComE [Lonepinella koalarum]|uniref:ComEA family DNA-binding protein n=1 Tax=Lonepinella koalarum TaxID=53417 RepID=UPI0011E3F7A3|nr:helix-hairpin-helix domain-containing protein [Lonepinella koalarum]TYG35082.1 competence protein ComE [Lonepinella koalarum]